MRQLLVHIFKMANILIWFLKIKTRILERYSNQMHVYIYSLTLSLSLSFVSFMVTEQRAIAHFKGHTYTRRT